MSSKTLSAAEMSDRHVTCTNPSSKYGPDKVTAASGMYGSSEKWIGPWHDSFYLCLSRTATLIPLKKCIQVLWLSQLSCGVAGSACTKPSRLFLLHGVKIATAILIKTFNFFGYCGLISVSVFLNFLTINLEHSQFKLHGLHPQSCPV